MVDFFSVINKDARLRKHMEAAKKAEAVGEFNGPDGDYVCNLKRFTAYEKDNAVSVIFEFRTINDGSDFENKKIVIFLKLDDGPLYSAEEAQDVMFQYIQLMGVETADRKQEDIEKDITTVVESESQIVVRKKTTVKMKDGKRVEYKNYSIVGTIESDNESDTPFVGTIEPTDVEVADNTEVTDADEWADVEEATETTDAEPEYKPSDYVGYECIYKGKVCKILSAVDADHTVLIMDTKSKRKVGVAFDQLEWPAE